MANKSTNMFDMAIGAGGDFVESVKNAGKKKKVEEDEE